MLLLLYTHILTIFGVVTSSNITITAGHSGVSLTDDVTVIIVGSDGGELVELLYGNQTLSSQIVTDRNKVLQENDDVTLVFDCGYFSRLGNYSFNVKRLEVEGFANEPLITSTSISVTKWPDIKLKWKHHHEAFSGDVKVTITYPPDICRSSIASQYKTMLVLVRDSVVVTTHDVTFPPTSIVFECNVFSRSGNYVVQLQRETFDGDVIVVRHSDVMVVDWSSEYAMQIAEKIFPCKAERLKIYVEKPPCAPPSDVIQVVEVLSNDKWRPIENLTADSSEAVVFSCPILMTSSTGICFRYVTSLTVTRTVCRPRGGGQDFNIDGVWTTWSHWVTCSRVCSAPIRYRARLCDNPKKWGRGADCGIAGESTQYDVTTLSSGNLTSCVNDVISVKNTSSKCLCGCAVMVLNKGVLASPLAGECQKSLMEWKLYAPVDHVIHLRFADFQLNHGETLVILDLSLSVIITSQTKDFTSQSNSVLVRYVTSVKSDIISSCGFVISYESISSENIFTTASSNGNADTDLPTQGAAWSDVFVKNPVAAIAVSVCVLVILVVGFTLIMRCIKQRKKEGKIKQAPNVSMQSRLIAPPDGKSSSNVDMESDRPNPIGDADVIMTPAPPRAAYYLAQRQLQQMKKDGKEESSQMYTSLCMNDSNIREQEDLLFGVQKETVT